MSNVLVNPNSYHDLPHEYILEACGLVRVWMKGIQQAAEHVEQKYDIRVALDGLYAHGGGWNPALPGSWDLSDDMVLTYINTDPDEENEVYHPYVMWQFSNGQQAAMYESAWVVVQTPEHGFEVVRMD